MFKFVVLPLLLLLSNSLQNSVAESSLKSAENQSGFINGWPYPAERCCWISIWTCHLAPGLSRRRNSGSARDFDIDLPLTGEPGVECRNTEGNHTFVVTFSNPPVNGSANVTSGMGSIAGSPAFNGNPMTINLIAVADVQKITVTLSKVIDSFGQLMPETSVSANILTGYTNGNKTVNATDIAQTKAQSGLPVSAANFLTDVNASGTITASDIAQLKAGAGNSLP